MDRAAMHALIERHMEAEAAGDLDATIAVYTDDIEHDMVGAPTGPLHGKEAARARYAEMVENTTQDEMKEMRAFYGENHCVIEHLATGAVPGEFLGMPGRGRQITFRMLHLFEFRDGLISRENVWIDGGSVAAQLMAPEPV